MENGEVMLNGVTTSRRRKSFGFHTASPSWQILSTIGGKFKQIKPLFSKDNNYFFILTSLELRVYLLATKRCVSTIRVDSSNATDMYLDSEEKIWISKSTGECDVINWIEKQVERTVKFDATRINQIVSIDTTLDKYTLLCDNTVEEGNIIKPSPSTGLCLVECFGDAKDDSDIKVLNFVKNARIFAVSNSKEYYAFYSAHKKTELITVCRLGDTSIRNVPRSRAVLSLAVSDSGVVAVGSVSGVIDMYYDCFSESSEPTMRSLKWHVDSVLSLSFSLDGDYLLSGGRERVLVFWQLETDNTQFLPRLDGELNGIYVNPTSEFYALTLGNDQVVVLSAVDLISRLQVSGIKAVINKFPADPEKERRRHRRKGTMQNFLNERVHDFTSTLYVHPKTKNLYFPTKSGSQIQVYDEVEDNQVVVFSVASTIQSGKVRSETLIEDPQVTLVAFTKDGQWMATVDEKKSTPPIDHLLSKDDKEVSLKFWNLNQSGKWELATRVSSPHGQNKSVLDLIPSPDGHAFVSAAQDGGLRLWRPSIVEKIGEVHNAAARKVAWRIRKIFAPFAIKSPSVSISWSMDTSVIIMGFESSVFVIDANKFELKYPLPNMLGSRIRALKIVGTKLVALAKARLVVWDLLSNSQDWSILVQSPTGGKRLFAVDEQNERFALAFNHFTKDYNVVSKLMIFSPAEPYPLHVEKYPYAISAVSFVPGSDSRFLLMDVNGRINTLVHDNKKQTSEEPTAIDYSTAISSLYYLKRQQQLQVSSTRQTQREDSDDDIDIDESSDQQYSRRVLNMNSFDNVFDGSEYQLQNLEVLFDKVLAVISPRTAR